MQMRTLGRTGLEVSVIGFGGIPIRRPPHEEAVALYRRALDLGVNYFDAARAYVRCEERIAEAIQGRRDEVVICSRDLSHTREEMAAAIEVSLATLGVEHIDVYLCHELHQMRDLEECLAPNGAFEALQAARDDGKIGHIGMTGHNPDVIMAGLETGMMDVVMVMLNFVNRRMLEDVLPRCIQDNVGVGVIKPLGGCLLASHADLALRWCLDQAGVHTVPVGMWRPFEVEVNAQVGESYQPLSEVELAVLDEQRAAVLPDFCMLCYRHHDCPHGVEISRLMIMHLLYTRHGVAEAFERGWDANVAAIEACFSCEERDECAASCHFGLDIPHELQRIYTRYMPVFERHRDPGVKP